MSNRVNENDVDVDEIRAKLTPTQVEDALSYLNEAAAIMRPLKEGYAEGTSPAVVRALAIVHRAMAEALNELDPDEELETAARTGAYGAAIRCPEKIDTTELHKSIARLEEMQEEFRREDEANANGRLIASAPDLLAACQLCLARDDIADGELGNVLRAAIDKAEGR